MSARGIQIDAVDAVCYLLERTYLVRRSLRRFTFRSNEACTTAWGHDASVPLDEIDVGLVERMPTWKADEYSDRFAPQCEACGYLFKAEDEWQVHGEWLWRDTRNGKLVTLKEAEPGAMWSAWWDTPTETYNPVGLDGLSLQVLLPGGHPWHIDGRCENCTMPEDRWQLKHKCWPRAGTVPKVTVSKKLGPTCSAGAGSVVTPTWHGYLVDGYLTQHPPP